MAGKDVPVSPLAPKRQPKVPAVPGVRFATAEAGIRYKGRTDVLLVLLDEGSQAAGVFTRSKCPSAPVDWCRANLAQGKARAIVVNSGNANAFTGLKGRDSVALTAKIAAKAAGCKAEEVFIASTGVIGEPLDATKFEGVLADCAKRAADGPWSDAAKAIMTTDTFPKAVSRKAKIDGHEVVIAGIAKGAGMIAPDMATMLSFVFTDAPIAAPVLQALLSKGVKGSFNAITVDSDTSTSDTLMLFSTAKAKARGVPEITDPGDNRLSGFKRALNALLLELSHLVCKDGEGARKFVEVRVVGAQSSRSAKKVALSIANSPLVKTAVAGEDANWGRIVMAVGKAGEPADRDKLDISFGAIKVAEAGARAAAYDEQAVSDYMKGEHIVMTADLGLGRGKATVWTCDLTKAYVEINGDYRS
ncbi:bifunctional glutamate N-acetyltransferase/amino-acid acetyltransferase ArgJ [Bosea vestrisii]|uniref:bifunctional glutamate N-acetyltransferase/amino-acid acetyltransferase ArgJ n=1 Tax=Bosea vestrisii TaxID=151416 RepID=UPI0024DF4476|nr:bifunctional glutamate N-acetyltransferase/amino-acid acetyltransferase ArgJ [Bosea vestrisii]WID99107.1 bifunctional glutamate N-acetyltransferase/amino-acid acetyltransferase ArgJ [Bosea vestrisii]